MSHKRNYMKTETIDLYPPQSSFDNVMPSKQSPHCLQPTPTPSEVGRKAADYILNTSAVWVGNNSRITILQTWLTAFPENQPLGEVLALRVDLSFEFAFLAKSCIQTSKNTASFRLQRYSYGEIPKIPLHASLHKYIKLQSVPSQSLTLKYQSRFRKLHDYSAPSHGAAGKNEVITKQSHGQHMFLLHFYCTGLQ